MSEGDIFREVEADLRREQLARYWHKYGIYVVASVLAIVLGVGGYQAWTWWQASRAASHGTDFIQASRLQSQDETDKAAQTFSALAEDGSAGYSALAQLRLAAISAAKGEKDAAVSAYDEVAKNANDSMLRDFARIQAATLLVDEAKPAEIEKRLEGMLETSNPWRHSAREMLALAAFRADQHDKARSLYQELLSDSETPAPMRRRAQMTLSLIGPSAAETSDAQDE